MLPSAKPSVEINQQALRLLYQKFGVVNTLRFLNQFKTGYGDYTKERKELFGKRSLNDIFSEIKAKRERS